DRLKEGYGLSSESIKFIKEKKISLVITVDCGISSFKEIDLLNELGIDVIITDHHEPRNKKLPKAFAIIDPHREDCLYPFKHLSGVGVAFKLAEAMYGKFLREHLDLVCLGTVADMVPLIGENRIFAKHGLGCLGETGKVGIRALVESSGLSNRKINETHIGYILGPRINSAGRISSPNTSLKLLLTKSKEEAKCLSDILKSENCTRQEIVEDILKEALLKIEKEINFKYHKVLVVESVNWHVGVIGIVASRITDRFFRPAIVISTNEELCKGSGRSIRNFHLFEALSECEELLNEYGGHKQAAGFSIMKRNIGPFRDKINRIADKLLDINELMPKLDIDMEIELKEITPELIRELEVMSPYGEENPEPLFSAKNLFLKTDIQYFGKDNVRMWISDGNLTYEAVGFGLSTAIPSVVKNDNVDIVYSPSINNFRNEDSVQLVIKDLRY
ncbi:MAG: single-stranded-DNA-specific exonuclease RecJ, partial [Candidatus Omnitrophica bacterium]|nr:single-stranded-DNA-specific exonuclease RecJ [Candidatus Omnitrophota bacterium]